MNVIKNYKLEEEGNEINLVIYIEPYFVEFASEDGDVRENYSLKEEIGKLLKSKFKNVKVNLCKVMVGSTLLLAIPAVTLPVQASGDPNITYEVKSGDTLWKISNQFDLSINDIKVANNLDDDQIFINQSLKIPTSNFIEHTVTRGETLYKIALNYNTSVNSIREINNLKSDTIYVGDKLFLINHSDQTIPETYKVIRGDTLWKISNQYNVSINKIKSLNNLTSDIIYPGQILNLKAEVVNNEEPSVYYINYKVVSGDNLWSIATDHGILATELQSVNGFTNNTVLSIGQTIKIPVHVVPVMETKGEQYGEYLDWWEGAHYVFPINDVAKITDFETGKTFNIQRTIGANHADCEPLTANDTAIAKSIWGEYSWKTRAVIVEVNGRKIAGSMSFMPHSIANIDNNNFDGHFDLHFRNSTRHKDGEIDPYHQEQIKIAAGIR